MRKRKGAAMATAILILGLFVLISVSISAIITNNILNNKYIDAVNEHEITFKAAFDQYVARVLDNDYKNAAVPVSGIEAESYIPKSYHNDGNYYIKGFALTNQSDEFKFFSVIEFNSVDNNFVIKSYQSTVIMDDPLTYFNLVLDTYE